jgi:hypothetical protein
MFTRSIREEEEEEEEEEEDYNDMPFESVSPDWKRLVLEVKNTIYNNVIFEPELESDEAQNIALVDTYRTHLIELNKLCKNVPNQINTKEEIQKRLVMFPMGSHDIIGELIHGVDTLFRKNQYVDTIPYTDYLDVHLRIYPFLKNDNLLLQK